MPPSLPKVQKGREPAHVLLPNQLGLEPTERVFSTSLPSARMRFLAIFKFWGATRMGKTWGHPFLTPTSLEAPTPTDFGLMARLLVRQTFLFTLVFVSFPLFFLYFWGGGWGARSAISHCHIISYHIINIKIDPNIYLVVNFLPFSYLGLPHYVTKILSRDKSTIIS